MSPFFFGNHCCCSNCNDVFQVTLENLEYKTGGYALIDTYVHESEGDVLSDSTVQTLDPDWASASSGQKSGAPYIRLYNYIYAEMGFLEEFPVAYTFESSVAWLPSTFVLGNRKLTVSLDGVRAEDGTVVNLFLRQNGNIYLAGGFILDGGSRWSGGTPSPDITEAVFGTSEYELSPIQVLEKLDTTTGLWSTSTKRVNIYEPVEVGIGIYAELWVNSSIGTLTPHNLQAANISGICWSRGETVSIPCNNYVCCFDDSEITTEVIGVTWPSGSYGYPAGSAGSAAKDFGLAFFQGWVESVINKETSFGGSPQCDCGWSIFSESVYSGAEKFQFRMTAYRNRETSGYRGVWVEITLNWITSSVNSFIKSTYRAYTDDQDECSGSLNLPWYQSTQTSGATYMGWFDFRNSGESVNVSW